MEDLLIRGVSNRSCIPQLNDCGTGPGTNKNKQRCKEYVSPVSLKHPMGLVKDMNRTQPGSFKLFRNKDCLECYFHTVHGFPRGKLETECYNPFRQQRALRSGKIIIDDTLLKNLYFRKSHSS
jgi:hypothetical protein